MSTINQTFAHEGRMPPLVEDNRLDAQFPNPNYARASTTILAPIPGTFPNYTSNIGDDNAGIVRLRRVWDSWSTEYSKAPATRVSTYTRDHRGFPAGPPFTPPIYPSYPPPYPARCAGSRSRSGSPIPPINGSNHSRSGRISRISFDEHDGDAHNHGGPSALEVPSPVARVPSLEEIERLT